MDGGGFAMRRAACAYVIGLGLSAAAASAASAACSAKNEGTNPPIDGGMADTGVADPGTGDGSVNNTWVIGVSDSLSGGLASIGGPLQNAVHVAETYINSN